jgi:hypothetical protein
VPLVVNATNPGWTLAGVTATLNSLSRSLPATITTATYTVLANDTHLLVNNASAITTITLPAAASFPGRELSIRNLSAAFTVVSATANVAPRVGGSNATAICAATAGAWAYLVSDGTQWQIQFGS